MNGKLQGIIICGVTAACLVGVMAFLNSTSGKSDADSSSSSTAAVNTDFKTMIIAFTVVALSPFDKSCWSFTISRFSIFWIFFLPSTGLM